MPINRRSLLRPLSVLLALGLSACGYGEAVYPEKKKGDTSPTWGEQKRQTVWGEGGLELFGGKKKSQDDGAGIGVNSFLWRATLDTVAFMPLASADPFGGVIITDWYTPPENPGERFKMTVLILDRALRADGLKVSVFRQAREPSGQWRDVAVEPRMSTEMENTILTRARELRTSSAEASK